MTSKKRVLDIEQVLEWLFRDQLPRRRDEGDDHRPGFPSVSPMFRHADLGGRIDSWAREPGHPLAMGEIHPDALIVEQAVLALEKFIDHDYVAAAELAGDDLGIATGLDESVDQAAAMARAGRAIVTLVVVNAKLNRRPIFSLPTAGPKNLGNGKPQVVREETRRWPKLAGGEAVETILVPAPMKDAARGYPDGAFCPVVYDPDAQEMLLERAEYAVWWAALHYLASELEGKLETISVLSPSAPQRPWVGELDLGKPSRIFACQRQAAAKSTPESAAHRRSFVERRPLRRGGHSATRSIPRTAVARAA